MTIKKKVISQFGRNGAHIAAKASFKVFILLWSKSIKMKEQEREK
jgi:hypothetical protein